MQRSKKDHGKLKIQSKCLGCSLPKESFFCRLPESDIKVFQSLKITNSYSRGATLFMEGEPVNGIYMLCQGRVKLSTCSPDGKIIILRIAEAGEVLGLSAAVSATVYEATAEAVEPSQINFVSKKDLLKFLKESPTACFSALKQLSGEYHTAFDQICSLGLSVSVGDRLAKLLLGWSKTNGKERIKFNYTHEEIAEMIGTTRETVTRLLRGFRDRNLISLTGSDLVIENQKALEAMSGIRD